MHKYLLGEFKKIKESIEKLESYFNGFNLSIEKDNNNEIEVYYDTKNNCYSIRQKKTFDFNESNKNNRNDVFEKKGVIETDKPFIPKGDVIIKLKEGTIRKRKDGRWEGRYYYSHTQKSIYAKTQAECIKKLKESVKIRDKNLKLELSINSISLNAWFDEWVKLYKNSIKEQSRYAITSKYNKYIKNSLGKKRMRNINTIDLQKVFNKIEYPVSRKKLYTYMKDVFEKAKINKIINENVMKGVIIDKNYKSKDKFVPNESQLRGYLDYLKLKRPELSYLCEFISLTGLRIGEACALTINDVDFNHKLINISKSYNRYTKSISTTKTYASNRVIPLFDDAAEIISIYLEKYKPKKEIFYKVKSQNVTNSVKWHAKSFGLEGLSPHGLRHYFSTRCLTAGIDPKVVQTWMGHTTIAMTLDVYTKVEKEYAKNQAKKYNDFIKK
ncbi:tyrosine-type recombinase/integrase [Candidatus Izemoplasma sp. B36]|uniref:tyrosine-type recombinase/integrase n=1 Tax=Candidatus Izemoplasma sp. B36 TaxID=3242468 RepID=UPI0035580DC2